MSDSMIYEGACHCRAVRFRFSAAPITDAMRCNCSICRRKNPLMSRAYYAATDFEVVAGADELTIYRFGDHHVNHNFCRHCGIYPFHGDEEVGYRVNLGCIDAIDDPHALPVRVFDGRDTWSYLD